ncbi:helix-turn-helix domain-containing protein [Caulobacter segnis]|uniref:helix-turn-helix domain-containing protein n=1 Tax=Caulobacter segnis TaxID=88688 RepID=UPI001CBEE3C3|nr:helix-turn-helix transcriptional regulator [Caulobacter segnis]UAL10763.1 helix-turn-helix transcriptional regulator [Caulobacter segnis]
MVQSVSAAFDKLTPREREILRLIAAHLQSKEIARALGLSPKTVEMHVLSARRRLSGMSRRDAALAFVAWEGEDPGNDYRRRPDGMATLAGPSLPDREIGGGDERAAPDLSGGPASARHGQAGQWQAALQDLIGPGEPPAAGRDWRHDMSNLQWLGLVAGVTALTAMLLAVTVIAVHTFILAIQRITGL